MLTVKKTDNVARYDGPDQGEEREANNRADAPYDLRTHNGCITVSPLEGGHRTFKVSTARKGRLKGKRIVSLLFGPDNSSNYQGFGFINDQGGINVWRKKDTATFREYASIVACPETYPNLEYRFEGRCRICNRRLTVPESIDSGIGPKCAADRRRPNHGKT